MATLQSDAVTQKIGGSILLAWVLTWSAGFVDSMGMLALFHVLVANMTGNTIAVAIGWITHDLGEVLRRGLAIPLYFFGMVLSRAISHFPAGKPPSKAASQAYFIEAFLLSTFVVLAEYLKLHGEYPQETTGVYFVLLAILTIAMGLQNTALLEFDHNRLLSTHVTGTLASCAEHLAKAVRKGWDGDLQSRSRHFRSAVFYGTAWMLYLVGAFPGAYLYLRYGPKAAAVPALVIFACSWVCRVRPSLAAGAEKAAQEEKLKSSS